MKSFFVSAFFLFIIFQNIIFTHLELPDFFRYWDEGIEILLIVTILIFLVTKRKININKRSGIIIGILCAFIFIGILGNICFNYSNSIDGIIRDIINFLKFPLTLILIRAVRFDEFIVQNLSGKVEKIIKIMIVVTFSFGIISLFTDIGMSHGSARNGIIPYKFLYSHPTYLVLSSILMLSYMQTWEKKKWNFIYEILLILTIILSMRTKGIVTVAVFIFIKYAPKFIKRMKFLYIGLAGVVGAIMAYNKLMIYNSYSTSPREVLYKGALELIYKCFPIGSGFSTYASHLSINYDSRVYDFIKVPLYNATELVYGDAGFAYYLGQFGFIGVILFIALAFNIYKFVTEKVKNKLPIILLFIYIIVALTSETILVNNGIELAVMISFIACKSRKIKNEGEN